VLQVPVVPTVPTALLVDEPLQLEALHPQQHRVLAPKHSLASDTMQKTWTAPNPYTAQSPHLPSE